MPTPFPIPSLLARFPCLSLLPKLQGPFFCLPNLCPEPISSTAHFFHLCEFLNKLSLKERNKERKRERRKRKEKKIAIPGFIFFRLMRKEPQTRRHGGSEEGMGGRPTPSPARTDGGDFFFLLLDPSVLRLLSFAFLYSFVCLFS